MAAAHRKGRAKRTGNASKPGPAPDLKSKNRLHLIGGLETLCALALTALIVFLHVYRARQAGGLWRDEVAGLNTATLPSLSQVWSSLIYGTHPLLSYAVFRIWTGVRWLGNTDTSLRVLGAVIGVGIVLVLWLNKLLLGYRVPILALVLFSLNPQVILWGDSVRGYGLGSLLILLVYGLVWGVVQSPTTTRFVLAALVSILAVQCLYQNAVLLFVICMGGFVVCLRKRMWKRMLVVIGIGASGALSLLPYLPVISKSRSIYSIADFSQDSSVILGRFVDNLSFGSFPLLLAWFICCGFCIMASVYLIHFQPKGQNPVGRQEQAIFSLTILVIVPLLLLLFTKSAEIAIQPWHFVAWMGPITLSIDVLLELGSTTPARRICRIAFVLVVACITIPETWRLIQDRQTNIDIIAKIVNEQASPEDLIVVNPWYCGVTFQRYYRGATRKITVPPIQQLAIVRYDLLNEQVATENPLRPVFDAVEKTLSSGNRVWLVGVFSTPPKGTNPPPLPRERKGPDEPFIDNYQNALSLQLGQLIKFHARTGDRIDLHINQDRKSVV